MQCLLSFWISNWQFGFFFPYHDSSGYSSEEFSECISSWPHTLLGSAQTRTEPEPHFARFRQDLASLFSRLSDVEPERLASAPQSQKMMAYWERLGPLLLVNLSSDSPCPGTSAAAGSSRPLNQNLTQPQHPAHPPSRGTPRAPANPQSWIAQIFSSTRTQLEPKWLRKNISQIGSFVQVGVKIQNVWNHHLDSCHEASSASASPLSSPLYLAISTPDA